MSTVTFFPKILKKIFFRVFWAQLFSLEIWCVGKEELFVELDELYHPRPLRGYGIARGSIRRVNQKSQK